MFTSRLSRCGISLLQLGLRSETVNMSRRVTDGEFTVYKVVLTGGPCGGKSTGQARLSTFFENLGWRVYRVPETARLLLSGGIKYSALSEKQAFVFQENLIRTMMQIEKSFFDLAANSKENCLVICDRGIMDASAYIPPEKWEKIVQKIQLNEIEILDNRYNQVINMVSAANGAEEFYKNDDSCREEGLEYAREIDKKTATAWVGHPYYDVIDNSTDFETKLTRMVAAVCKRLGIDTRDRLAFNSRKVAFLICSLPDESLFPRFQDFDVVHDYLITPSNSIQARLRKRGQNGKWTYTYTVRNSAIGKQVIEERMQISSKEYQSMMVQKTSSNLTIFKMRRCFLWHNQYFQLDVYKDPCHPRCKDLILLETYTTLDGRNLVESLPPFLNVIKDVTNDPSYSMYNLSLKEDWNETKHFVHNISSNIEDH